MTKAALRRAEMKRQTKETRILMELALDGNGTADIRTGVGFLDHMLTLFTVHGLFNLFIEAEGDIEVDDHHTVEDIGICLGTVLKQSLGDMAGICRYGYCYVPMDETLVRVCVDISNRAFLHYNVSVPDQKVGSFDTSLGKEFLRAFVLHAGLTLHVDLLHGENSHHILEAVFKALARTLAQAVAVHPTITGQLSSKGLL
jgi:imidazoleglycerol-phosphate dehydratase